MYNLIDRPADVPVLITILITCTSLISGHIIRTSSSAPNEFNVSVRFPSDVTEGDNVTLTCDYDLKGKQLYSIRWYFNGDEVYRFNERPKQSKKVSPVNGITVDRDSSTRDSLSLRNIVKAGQFLCEVTEYQSFQSSRFGDRLNVTMVSNSSIAQDKNSITIALLLAMNASLLFRQTSIF